MSKSSTKPSTKPTDGPSHVTARTAATAKPTAAAAGPAPHDQKMPAADQVQPRRTSKQDQLGALLVRDEGATIEHMTEATGWLPHTVRAALTGLKKKGYVIDSDKVEGIRTYRAVAPR